MIIPIQWIAEFKSQLVLTKNTFGIRKGFFAAYSQSFPIFLSLGSSSCKPTRNKRFLSSATLQKVIHETISKPLNDTTYVRQKILPDNSILLTPRSSNTCKMQILIFSSNMKILKTDYQHAHQCKVKRVQQILLPFFQNKLAISVPV